MLEAPKRLIKTKPFNVCEVNYRKQNVTMHRKTWKLKVKEIFEVFNRQSGWSIQEERRNFIDSAVTKAANEKTRF